MRPYEYVSALDGPQGRLRPDGKLVPGKGGGGGSAYYKNANELYGAQADSAKFMLDLGREYVPGALADYAAQAAKYQDPAYVERMAGQAATDASTAISQGQAALHRDMARYGLNPASGRFGSTANAAALEGARMKAGMVNAARSGAEDKAFAASKDFYNNLAGMPSDAAATAGGAASGFAQIGANKDAAAGNEAAGWGNAAGTAIGVYSAFRKDGGIVRMADGGLMPSSRGLLRSTATPPPQPIQQAQAQTSPMVSGLQSVKTGKKLGDAMTGAGADKAMGDVAGGLATVADATGSMAAQGAALNAAGASGAVSNAASQAGMLAAQNIGLEGAAAATTQALGAGTSAATSAAAATSPFLAGAAAALPWIGAAAALGSMFGLFADGGEVGTPEGFSEDELFQAKANLFQAMFNAEYHGHPEEDAVMQRFAMSQLKGMDPDGAVQSQLNAAPRGEPMMRVDATDGGQMRGPGTGTSDDIPVWVSDKEFVVNSDAVEEPGVLSKLKEINQLGLKKRYGNRRMAA